MMKQKLSRGKGKLMKDKHQIRWDYVGSCFKRMHASVVLLLSFYDGGLPGVKCILRSAFLKESDCASICFHSLRPVACSCFFVAQPNSSPGSMSLKPGARQLKDRISPHANFFH